MGIDSTCLPVTDAERSLASPVVEKNAADGRGYERVSNQYVRLKVFNGKGKEKAATLDIPVEERVNILNLAARTVKPDGTVLELAKDAAFEQSQEVRGVTVPAREYTTLPSYFEGLSVKQVAPVVLAKKQ
jgi:hypothetical protein